MNQTADKNQLDLSALFAPATVGGLSLPNRLAMAPMTRSFSPGGVPGPDVVDYYARRARGGVGLIITEGTWINHPQASNDSNVPNFFGEAALAGWRAVVDAVHAEGAKIIPQIWHVGLFKKRALPGNTAPDSYPARGGPSGYLTGTERAADPLSVAEIEEIIRAYGEAAATAKMLGFDGVEIHGGHGYLVDQFFWAATNRRTDAYGGDLTSRSRFAAEVVRECRRQVGPGFPIILRFSQFKQQDYTAQLATTPQELEAMLAPIVEAGVDILHPSTRRYWDSAFDGSELSLAGWTRKITGKPTIIVGSVGLDRGMEAGPTAAVADLSTLMERFRRSEFDIVAVGRALISNPDWCDLNRTREWHRARPYSIEHLAKLV